MAWDVRGADGASLGPLFLRHRGFEPLERLVPPAAAQLTGERPLAPRLEAASIDGRVIFDPATTVADLATRLKLLGSGKDTGELTAQWAEDTGHNRHIPTGPELAQLVADKQRWASEATISQMWCLKGEKILRGDPSATAAVLTDLADEYPYLARLTSAWGEAGIAQAQRPAESALTRLRSADKKLTSLKLPDSSTDIAPYGARRQAQELEILAFTQTRTVAYLEELIVRGDTDPRLTDQLDQARKTIELEGKKPAFAAACRLAERWPVRPDGPPTLSAVRKEREVVWAACAAARRRFSDLRTELRG